MHQKSPQRIRMVRCTIRLRIPPVVFQITWPAQNRFYPAQFWRLFTAAKHSPEYVYITTKIPLK